jgi:hypothetical protein
MQECSSSCTKEQTSCSHPGGWEPNLSANYGLLVCVSNDNKIQRHLYLLTSAVSDSKLEKRTRKSSYEREEKQERVKPR